MYYQGVNRGLFVTTPGKYTVALVMALGFIAIASGYNGIYLSVSLGFAVLIISGLLSEKFMYHYELESIEGVLAEPRTPFSVNFRVSNLSPDISIYGIENWILEKTPKLPRIREKMKPLMQATVLLLEPGSSKQVTGQCLGMERGLYREFTALQRTLYPFGLLAKFKLSTIPADIAILPAFDETLAAALRESLGRRLSGTGLETQFHSHRPYSQRDSRRFVDWKKSAGREPSEWVLKVFESFTEDFGVYLDPCWDWTGALTDEVQYEGQLSALRTACEIVRECGRRLVLPTERGLVSGYEASVRALVEAPRLALRGSGLPGVASSKPVSGIYWRLQLRGREFGWSTEPIHVEED